MGIRPLAHDNAEPSVEEILASIKKVMAADSKAARKTSDSAPSYRKLSRGDDEPVLELGAFQEPIDSDDEQDDSAEALIAKDQIDSVRASLAALSTLSEPGKAPQIVRSGETSLEGLIRDMLRPLLKEWLDDNLPTLVEHMVADEIKRITRKG